MTDPIFHAAAYLERVCTEITHLSDEIVRSLGEQGLEVSIHDDNLVSENQMSGLRYGFSYALRRAFRSQRKSAQLILKFDLWRPDQPSNWPHAQDALLVVGYDSDLADGWDADQLNVQADGRLEDADHVEMLQSRYDGRALLWTRRETDPTYARQAWFFGVRLRDIQDVADARRMVVDPVLALLRAPETADAVLTRAGTVIWPSHPVSPDVAQ